MLKALKISEDMIIIKISNIFQSSLTQASNSKSHIIFLHNILMWHQIELDNFTFELTLVAVLVFLEQ